MHIDQMAAANGNNEEQNATRRDHEERYNELEKQIGNQEIRIHNLQNSAFQLANYFFVFQGVVVAAISNNSSLVCSDAWFIFSLSSLAAALNLFALFSIASKYVRAMDLHEQTWSEYNRTAALIHHNRAEPLREGNGQGDGEGNGQGDGQGDGEGNGQGDGEGNGQGDGRNNNNRQWRDHFAQRRRYVVLAVCMGLFLVFTAVTLAGPWVITCKRDRRLRESRRRIPGSDCFRVCDDGSSSCMFFCK